MQPLFLKECLYTPWHIGVFHKSRKHVGKFHMLGKRVERPVAITYRNSFKSFTRRKSHVGRGVHASEKRTSGKVHASGNARRENERRERGLRVGKRMSGQDERRERGSCVGKRTSGEVFTHRGRCVPQIVSFWATIAFCEVLALLTILII